MEGWEAPVNRATDENRVEQRGEMRKCLHVFLFDEEKDESNDTSRLLFENKQQQHYNKTTLKHKLLFIVNHIHFFNFTCLVLLKCHLRF